MPTQNTNEGERTRHIPAHLLGWWLPVGLVRCRLVLLRRRVAVRSGLVGLVLRGSSVVSLRGRGPVMSGRPAVAPRGGVPLLVWGGAAAATAEPPVVVLDHHLDIALGVVRRLTHSGQGHPARGRVRPGVRLGRNLDTAPSAVLQLLDGRATLADHKAHLTLLAVRTGRKNGPSCALSKT